ncbi:hypothetical protein [Shouchella tritolerans]|uniref:hypothetical protein n=1 Tax=Shouchella tritolerans TaxID=2979466 RepID=UPI0021E94F1B|nr:hypothetical protein [Shouchella tritolerans]
MPEFNPLEIPFGPATYILDEGLETELSFDGVNEMQNEGGELTLTPETEDIVILDYGNTAYDKRLVGWEAEVVISAARQTLEIMHAAMSFANPIMKDGKIVGLQDAPIGSSARLKGRTLTIRPRNAKDRSTDIFLFKVVASGEFTRSYGNEQGNVPLTLSVLPKDGADPTKDGNYFRIGGVEEDNGDDTPSPTPED